MRVSSRLETSFSFPRIREVAAVDVRPDFDAKERVRQAVDIVDLMGGYMELLGVQYWGRYFQLCHEEREC